MRKLLVILLVTGFAVSCSQSGKKTEDSSQEQKLEIAADKLSNIKLDVKGMTCEGCEKAVMASVQKLEGIQEVSASHTEGSTNVSFDPEKTDLETITGAITDAGYEVTGHAQ